VQPTHAQPARWNGRLALGTGVIAYAGPGASAQPHRHDAIQLVWSRAAPVHLTLDGATFAARAAIVPAGREHGVATDTSDLVIVFVEPAGAFGATVARFAEAHRGADVAGLLAGRAGPPDGDADALVTWSRCLLADLCGFERRRLDGGVRPEVLAAARYVHERLDPAMSAAPPRLGDAAQLVGLSERQLSRSFGDELGVPFRRYVLWSRLRRAVIAVRDGADLTAAAAGAGFADSAHFSRVFRQMFGLSPSTVLPVLEIAATDVDRS
jgi:AraC-like DNA-binding protein